MNIFKKKKFVEEKLQAEAAKIAKNGYVLVNDNGEMMHIPSSRIPDLHGQGDVFKYQKHRGEIHIELTD